MGGDSSKSTKAKRRTHVTGGRRGEVGQAPQTSQGTVRIQGFIKRQRETSVLGWVIVKRSDLYKHRSYCLFGGQGSCWVALESLARSWVRGGGSLGWGGGRSTSVRGVYDFLLEQNSDKLLKMGCPLTFLPRLTQSRIYDLRSKTIDSALLWKELTRCYQSFLLCWAAFDLHDLG